MPTLLARLLTAALLLASFALPALAQDIERSFDAARALELARRYDAAGVGRAAVAADGALGQGARAFSTAGAERRDPSSPPC